MLTWAEQIETELALEEHILSLKKMASEIEKELSEGNENYSQQGLDKYKEYIAVSVRALAKIKTMETVGNIK
jgi:hypothetical protein